MILVIEEDDCVVLNPGASHVLASDVSTNMVEEAKKETDKYLLDQ